MTTKERLYAFLSAKKIKPSTFERACGLSNGFCSKVSDNITEGSLTLIGKGFPELNLDWLKTGHGEMLIEDAALEYSKSSSGDNMLAMVRMMGEFIDLGKKNADANLMNAEANKLNAHNLERLITLLEKKFG